MPQDKLNIISINLSKFIGDEVSQPNLDGVSYSAKTRLDFINSARFFLYNKSITELGLDNFCKMFPEFVGFEEKVIFPNKDLDIRTTLKLFNDDKIITKIPPFAYTDGKYNPFSSWYGTEEHPFFAEHDNFIELIGINQLNECMIEYVKQPTSINGYGGNYPDLIEPFIWTTEITNIAYSLILKSQQIT